MPKTKLFADFYKKPAPLPPGHRNQQLRQSQLIRHHQPLASDGHGRNCYRVVSNKGGDVRTYHLYADDLREAKRKAARTHSKHVRSVVAVG